MCIWLGLSFDFELVGLGLFWVWHCWFGFLFVGCVLFWCRVFDLYVGYMFQFGVCLMYGYGVLVFYWLVGFCCWWCLFIVLFWVTWLIVGLIVLRCWIVLATVWWYFVYLGVLLRFCFEIWFGQFRGYLLRVRFGDLFSCVFWCVYVCVFELFYVGKCFVFCWFAMFFVYFCCMGSGCFDWCEVNCGWFVELV